MAVSNVDARALLASRVIPTMSFSTASNTLTAPLPVINSTNAIEHAISRFAIQGGAIITGGAGALALTATRALLQHGLFAVFLFDLSTTLESSAKDIQALKSSFPNTLIRTLAVDVTSPSDVNQAFEQASSEMGGISTLCCFAGIVKCMGSIDIGAEEFRRVIDVNLVGSFLCAQAAARYMIASKSGGSIVLTASISAHHTNFPQPQSAYNVSKAGVAHLTRNLAAEWAVHGIRVNSISPGYMNTILNAGDGLKDIRGIWNTHCPMGRMGEVEEITGAVVLLCSQRAGRYITGIDIIVDGGSMCL